MIKGLSYKKKPIIFMSSGDTSSIILAETTFTTLSYADNGGKVQLSSAGVHALTTSPAVGKSIYVTWSGGTGIDGLYKILSVDSTTAVTIDLTYVSGLGTPTVAVKNTEVSLASITIPPLKKNSVIVTYGFLGHTISANSKLISTNLAGSKCAEEYPSSANAFTYLTAHVMNYNDAAHQVVNSQCNIGQSSNSIVTRTVDTSSPTEFYISAKPAAANEYVELFSYLIEVYV